MRVITIYLPAKNTTKGLKHFCRGSTTCGTRFTIALNTYHAISLLSTIARYQSFRDNYKQACNAPLK